MLYLLFSFAIIGGFMLWHFWPQPERHWHNLKQHSLSSLHYTRLLALASQDSQQLLWSYGKQKQRLNLNGQSQSLLAVVRRIHPDDRPSYLQQIRQACQQPQSWQSRFRWRAADGEHHWFEERGQSWVDGQLAAVATPSTSLAQSLSRLNFLSSAHPLTGLPNRQCLHQHLNALQHDVDFKADRLAIILLNIDHFGQINSLYGQHGGDELLQQCAQRLAGIGAPITLVSHLGGDEFALVAEDFHSVDKLRQLGHSLLQLFKHEFLLQQHPLLMTASIGMATVKQSQINQSLARGHDALKMARQAGGNCVRLLEQDLAAISTQAIQFEQDLRHAIADQQLELLFQPKICLHTEQILGAEALLRWPHPSQGMLSAAAFINLAENSGLIRDLGLQVIEMACLSALALRASQHQCPIAINLSSKQLIDEGLPDYIRSRLDFYGLQPGDLDVELTESCLVDSLDDTRRILERFAEQGIAVALDDFGSGYASFRYLAELPFTTLKIDRSFISELLEKPKLRDLMAIMIDLGHSLDLQVVAEGIESQQQMQLLAELGCDQGQGFYIGRPMPMDELMLRLNQQRPRVAAPLFTAQARTQGQ